MPISIYMRAERRRRPRERRGKSLFRIAGMNIYEPGHDRARPRSKTDEEKDARAKKRVSEQEATYGRASRERKMYTPVFIARASGIYIQTNV